MANQHEARPVVRAGTLWYANASTGLRLVVSHYLPGPQRARLASEHDVRVLAALDGGRTVAEIASALGLPANGVLNALDAWQARAPGSVRLGDAPPRVERAAQAARQMMEEWRSANASPADTAHYHLQEIGDPLVQFERVETTLSHSFREPHAALQGRSYGQALCDRLVEMGAVRPGARVLEIGCGLGDVAAALLGRLEERWSPLYDAIEYTLFDLSPALRAAQQRTCARHAARTRFVHGDVLAHDFGDARWDLVLVNEVIADLPVERADADRLRAGRASNRAEQMVSGHGLAMPTLPSFLVNVGALALVDRLPGLLLPGGLALLTEYGAVDEFPRAVPLGGHVEHTIHFGHLMSVARRAGLACELVNVESLLGFRGEIEVIGAVSYDLLSNWLLPLLDEAPLPSRALTPSDLSSLVRSAVLEGIGNIRFHPVADRRSFMSPSCFQALLLSAP